MRASFTTALLAAVLLARGEAAQQVRVTLRVIDVPHAQVVKWTGGAPMKGWQLHDEAVKLALAGGAEIVETNVLTVGSGLWANMQSVAEILYPIEVLNWDPRGLPTAPSKEAEATAMAKSARSARPSHYYSFETRNTGDTLVIEPTVASGGGMVDLRLSFDMVDRASLATFTEFRDHWGDASIRTPVFDTKQFSSLIPLADGVFELWNVFNPKPVAVPAVTTRMMVFVCADVLPTGL
jgi:hypothetical protein